jgi:AcrR family transcriptional regulator
MADRREKTPDGAASGKDEQRKQVRGPRLVAKVLETTLAELARIGYEKLSIEQVAERAQVNKVTIYRHWPTKRELAKAALRRVAAERALPVDTGSVRDDLLALLRSIKELADSPTRRALLHVIFAGSEGDEIVQLAKSITQENDEQVRVIYSRAVERGQLPPGVNFDLVHSLLIGAVLNRCHFKQQGLGDRELEYVVDLVLTGVEALAHRPSKEQKRAGRGKASRS